MYALTSTCLIAFIALFGATECVPLIQPRIVGGTDATNQTYVAAILSEGKLIGAGSIIGNKTILTSAEILRTNRVSVLKVVVGSINYTAGVQLNVASKILHPYSGLPFLGDKFNVGLLILQQDLVFNASISKINLPTVNIGTNLPVATVSGWGSKSTFSTNPSTILQNLQGWVLNWVQCNQMSWLQPFNMNQICTVPVSGEGTCHKDSGDPLVINGTQVGIATLPLFNACKPGFEPNTFTNVYSHISFILSNLQ